MKSRQNPTTPINQVNIIKLTLPEPPTWMQMATKLHNDGRKEFRRVCSIARICAQSIVFPDDRSFFALIDRMKIVQKDSPSLNFAIDQIEDVYNEVYSLPEQVDPCALADVIPFPMSVQGGGK